jgi:hypothetical protein
MECGVLIISNFVKVTKAIIKWIKNLVMEFINGKMDGFIKEIFRMIIEMGSVNYLMVKTVFIEVIGLMDNKHKINHHNSLKQPKQIEVSKWAKLVGKRIGIITKQWTLSNLIKWQHLVLSKKQIIRLRKDHNHFQI